MVQECKHLDAICASACVCLACELPHNDDVAELHVCQPAAHCCRLALSTQAKPQKTKAGARPDGGSSDEEDDLYEDLPAAAQRAAGDPRLRCSVAPDGLWVTRAAAVSCFAHLCGPWSAGTLDAHRTATRYRHPAAW